MNFKDLVIQNRSYRRFDNAAKLEKPQLLEWVDHARLSPNATNAQGLRFYLVWEEEEAARVFETVTFGGYFREWGGPEAHEQPTAYIIILGDHNVKTKQDIDCGIAAQSIALAASAAGYACLMMTSFKRTLLNTHLNLPENLEILLVLALGKPGETVKIEPVDEEHGIVYWRDAAGVHHVPKRTLDEITIWKGKL